MALLETIAFGTNKLKNGFIPTYSFISLSSRAPKFRDSLVYTGRPGRDDLESTGSRPTAIIWSKFLRAYSVAWYLA